MTINTQRDHGCPMCGGPGEPLFEATDRNREISTARFPYDKCTSCATVYIRQIPTDLDSYYKSGYYPFDHEGNPFWKSNPQKLLAERFRVQLIQKYVKGGSLIDIGAGSGGFSAAARDGGFDVTAIEMDSQCCQHLQNDVGVKVMQSASPIEALSALPPAEAIALWHVLEHLVEPLKMLEVISGKLQSGGVLALAVPNPDSLQFRLMRTRWAHLDAPRHLLLTPPETLERKLGELGLSCVAATTSDPDGVECDLFGWVNCLRSRPASGSPSKPVLYAALGLCRLAAPLERGAMRGAAATFVFRKEDA